MEHETEEIHDDAECVMDAAKLSAITWCINMFTHYTGPNYSCAGS